ncbi:MAG: GNAT family N-acetyltransferase [Planctomycetota bacterium]|jgi:ribosomal protein S18 acetylase RimI-like enzyme
MRRSPVKLRAARPTLEDGQLFARYLDVAAEGFMSLLYGRRASEVIAHAYTHPGNDLSFENVSFAEDSGRVVGMASSFTADDHSRFSDPPRNLRASFLGTLLLPMFRVLSTVPPDSSYLLALAVDEGARSCGVGSRLIDHVEAVARQRGSRRLQLDVAASNEGAQRLYSRRGMTVESRWPRLRMLPAVLLRMTKSL